MRYYTKKVYSIVENTRKSNWLTKIVNKQARRRYRPGDKVRYFTKSQKGTGKGHVLTPPYERGTVQDFDPVARRYSIISEAGETVVMHPKNLTWDTIVRG